MRVSIAPHSSVLALLEPGLPIRAPRAGLYAARAGPGAGARSRNLERFKPGTPFRASLGGAGGGPT
jgi:hypothetical protein